MDLGPTGIVTSPSQPVRSDDQLRQLERRLDDERRQRERLERELAALRWDCETEHSRNAFDRDMLLLWVLTMFANVAIALALSR